MISLNNIHLNFGPQVIFEGISVQFNVHERTAIVGANGSGKSTLFKLITGQLTPSKGDVHLAKSVDVGLLPQELDFTGHHENVLDFAMSAFQSARAIEKELEKLSHLIEQYTREQHPDLEDELNRYGRLQQQYEDMEAFKLQSKAESVLLGLGFTVEELAQSIQTLSGGWRMRAALARLLLQEPDYLLLDEPTNHLDLETLDWLESFLKAYPGGMMIISHDQYFLDNLVKRVIEIEFSTINEYAGNYTDYEIEKASREDLLMARYVNQQKKLVQVERFIERFRYKASKAKQVQSRIKQLEKVELVEIGKKRKTVRFEFPEPPRSGRMVSEASKLNKKFGNNIVFDHTEMAIERGEKIGLMGINGSGKSTLIRLILGKMEADSGFIRLGHNVACGYYAQHQLDELNPDSTIIDELTGVCPADYRPKLRTFLGSFLFHDEDVFKKIKVLSGGEKARVALAKMLIQPYNFIIMDEPTNHLDVETKDILIHALQDFSGTLLIVSHDRYFLELVVGKLIYIQDRQIKTFMGDFEQFYKNIWPELSKPVTEKKEDNRQEKPNEYKSREKKRLEAEARKQKYAVLKPLKEKLKSIEAKISQTEAEILKMESEIADESFYLQPPEDVTEHLKAYEKLKSNLDNLMSDWMIVNQDIELMSDDLNG